MFFFVEKLGTTFITTDTNIEGEGERKRENGRNIHLQNITEIQFSFDAGLEIVQRDVSTSFHELVNVPGWRETRENYKAIAANGHF